MPNANAPEIEYIEERSSAPPGIPTPTERRRHAAIHSRKHKERRTPATKAAKQKHRQPSDEVRGQADRPQPTPSRATKPSNPTPDRSNNHSPQHSHRRPRNAPEQQTGTPNAFQHAVRGHAATPNTHGPHAAPAPSTARHSHQAAQPPTSALQKPANNPRQRPKKRQTPRRNTGARRKHGIRTGRTAADTLWTAVPAHPTTRPLSTRTPRQRVRGTHRAPESPPLGLPLASTASPLPSALSQQPRWGSAKSLNSHGGSLRNLSTATVGYPVISQQQIRGTLQSLNSNFLCCIFLHFVS